MTLNTHSKVMAYALSGRLADVERRAEKSPVLPGSAEWLSAELIAPWLVPANENTSSFEVRTESDLSRDAAAMKEALALARRLGVPLLRPLKKEKSGWSSWEDGFRAQYAPGVVLYPDAGSANVFHEVAHFQLASPERRSIPNFGFGSSPLGGSAEQLLTDSASQEEELLACVLGAVHVNSAGFSARESLDYVGPLDEGVIDNRNPIRDLTRPERAMARCLLHTVRTLMRGGFIDASLKGTGRV